MSLVSAEPEAGHVYQTLHALETIMKSVCNAHLYAWYSRSRTRIEDWRWLSIRDNHFADASCLENSNCMLLLTSMVGLCAMLLTITCHMSPPYSSGRIRTHIVQSLSGNIWSLYFSTKYLRPASTTRNERRNLWKERHCKNLKSCELLCSSWLDWARR